MIEIDREIATHLGRGTTAERAAVEDQYRRSQDWLRNHYGPIYERHLGRQTTVLVEAGIQEALGMTADEYIASLPTLSSQPFTKIGQEVNRTEFYPLLVEGRLPVENLLESTGFSFPEGFAQAFKDHSLFPTETYDPYIAWVPVDQENRNQPQRRIITLGQEYEERNVGIIQAINFTLQASPFPDGFRAQVPYDSYLVFRRNHVGKDWDYINLGYENGKPFVRVPDMPQA